MYSKRKRARGSNRNEQDSPKEKKFGQNKNNAIITKIQTTFITSICLSFTIHAVLFLSLSLNYLFTVFMKINSTFSLVSSLLMCFDYSFSEKNNKSP